MKISGPWGVAEFEPDHPPHPCYALVGVDRDGGWTPIAVFIDKAQAVASQWSHWSEQSFLNDEKFIVIPASLAPVELGVRRTGEIPDFIGKKDDA